MKLIGLTGGIASGKSTVARILRDRGVTVIDADALARDVVRPGKPAWQEIRDTWPDVIGADGELDRKALGERVFTAAAARAQLNAMTHPRIAEESVRLREEAEARGEAFAIYEAALICENGLDAGMDGLIVVGVPEEVQRARLVGRDGLSEVAARARIAAQLPLAEKVKRATWVVDNAGSPEATRAQVDRLWPALVEFAKRP